MFDKTNYICFTGKQLTSGKQSTVYSLFNFRNIWKVLCYLLLFLKKLKVSIWKKDKNHLFTF